MSALRDALLERDELVGDEIVDVLLDAERRAALVLGPAAEHLTTT